MAAIINIYFKAETLKKLADTVAKKGDKGVSITVSVNDETDKYGQNVGAYVSQTKEQQEQKVKRFYVANGRVAWHNDKIVKGEKPVTTEHQSMPTAEEGDDLPF